MRQFDVLENPRAETAAHSPFLAVLQSHHLNTLETIFLAPIIQDSKRPVNPVDIEIEFEGRQLVLAVGEAAGVPKASFGKVVGSIAQYEDAIRRAFERLLSGF